MRDNVWYYKVNTCSAQVNIIGAEEYLDISTHTHTTSHKQSIFMLKQQSFSLLKQALDYNFYTVETCSCCNFPAINSAAK